MTIDDAVKLLREARDVCEYPEFIQSSGNISHARQVRALIDAALTAYDAEPEAIEAEPVEWEPCDGFSRIIKAPFTLEVQRMGRFWEWQAIELGVTRTEDEAKAAALRAARRLR